MKIEIWSDIVCPFCYIGKRHLEEAMKRFNDASNVEVVWKSFQLDPHLPQDFSEGYVSFVMKKKNITEEQAMQMMTQINSMASEVGLTYDFKDANVYNTFRTHCLLTYAKELGKANELEEAFFEGYFVKKQNLSDEKVLLEIAKSVLGENSNPAIAFNDDKYAYEVRSDISEASSIGVGGVPFFVFDRKYAISGAQPIENILQTIEKAYQEWAIKNNPTNLKISHGSACDMDGNCN